MTVNGYMVFPQLLYILALLRFHTGYCGTLQVFTDAPMSWDDARSFCQSQGMDLVIIEDSTEMARVDDCVVNNGGFVQDCWVGGYYDYTYNALRWIDNTPLSHSHPEWASSEPNCLPGSSCSALEECVRVSTTLSLKTRGCLMLFDVICEAPDGIQSCIYPTTTGPSNTQQESTSNKKGISTGAIIGLAVGFASFILTVLICCCVWKTFCGISEDDKIAPDPDGIHSVNLSEAACHQIATDNPWLKHEEVSFCLRNKYTFETSEAPIGTRSKYIK